MRKFTLAGKSFLRPAGSKRQSRAELDDAVAKSEALGLDGFANFAHDV